MRITKKFDRAFQWAGEKMGAEAKTNMSEDFKMLEIEMALRFEGMERLQKSMNAYIKWLGRRGETFDDKEKGLPASYLGRTMLSHGEDFEADSEFGNCLIAMGRANERLAGVQEHFVADATSTWLESLERSLAMMKEYQSARKKLENRRLAYDASITKMQKAKRDDFRVEEELRANKAKYEESSEDVLRRMQDIKDAEVDSVRDLTGFLDAELDYHERCADELRRVRQSWAADVSGSSGHGDRAGSIGGGGGTGMILERRPTGRSRSNTAHSFSDKLSRTNSRNNIYEVEEPRAEPAVRTPIRNTSRPGIGSSSSSFTWAAQQPDPAPRPTLTTAHTFHSGLSIDRGREQATGRTAGSGSGSSYGGYNSQGGGGLNMGSLRAGLRPTSRAAATREVDVFADRDDDTASGSGSPEWGERSASPATSFDSLSRSTSNLASSSSTTTLGQRKAPPPPPPSRSKKPPPPVPAKREVGY